MSVVQHTAIVSGGNTGIGAAIARGLLAEGYDVISLSRRKPDWSHPKLSSREVDLLDATATRQAADEIAAKVAITHVVHNAGAIRAKPLEEVADEDVGALAQLHFGAAGPIGDTEMFESVMSPESERAKKLAQSIPLGRLGKSADVARAVSFFSSPDADFITGQTLYVCGGASIG